MSEIKSEKALSFIREHILIQRDGSKRVMHYIAESAVGIAETEADQRHAKAMQELRDKAVGAYKECCPFIGSTGNCTKGDTDCDWSCPRQGCEFILQFTEKLKQ